MSEPLSQAKEFTEIGHYTILSAIGRGGMGLVYLARDTRLGRQVAIKCLRTELVEDHYRERFKREALLLAKLNHPHIVQIYDYIETHDQLGLVMEFVDGQNLQQHLREHIVPLAQRMQWLTQIAQGLAVAHDAGIIHRDLKAENILINQHKLAKITDLGIAKSQDFNGTLTDHVTGSYGSMSPEQAMGEELDNRSDLFSFGILAYQLLCGAHPFGGTQNKLQLMQRIISHPPIPPTKNNPDLPVEAVELLGQLLSKNPDNRPANTHWVALQCEKLYQILAANTLATDVDRTQILPQTHTSKSGIRNTNSTQSNSTFDAPAPKKVPTLQRLKNYLHENNITVMLASLSITIMIAAIIWQLQPKPPRYIAVLAPMLTANGMQESQQTLMKSAVYDAIQQSVLQLKGYYLIPRNEVADINATNDREGIETIRRATAADELITADIQCKIEACTITLSRLTPEGKKQESRLRVQETKTVNVLTDSYLSVATIVQSNIGGLYAKHIANTLAEINTKDYEKYLTANQEYITTGASQELLTTLDNLQPNTKSLSVIQDLYTQASLDIYNETQNIDTLKKLETFLTSYTSESPSHQLINFFYLRSAQQNHLEENEKLTTIKNTIQDPILINELTAYSLMQQKDYLNAIKLYKKNLQMKPTASTSYWISLAYAWAGNWAEANRHINETLKFSPSNYKAYSLKGVIALTQGNITEAISAFEKTIELHPTNTDNINNLGLCYLLTKEYSKAISLFSQANQLLPNITSHILNKADAESLAGNTQGAEKDYLNVVELLKKPELNSDELIDLAQANAHLNRFSDALTTLQQLEKLDSQSYKTTYTAALTHTLSGNYASAVLNVRNSLNNNLNIIWFNFPWFDVLCDKKEFKDLMQSHGEPNRCALHSNIKPD